MVGKFVKSKSGHDKDTIYIVISENEKFVYLVDGIYKTIEKPKKKNKKHLQIINKESELANKIIANHKITNEEIKRDIKILTSN